MTGTFSQVLIFTTILCCLYSEMMKTFLLYEDQESGLCSSRECMNFLTLKKKLYEKEQSMKDFTVCFRLKLFSYRGKAVSHIVIRAKTDKYLYNTEQGNDWTTGFHFDLNPRDGTDNGVNLIQTFNENLMDVLDSNGSYAIWPIYKNQINANEWNSFCFGSNLAAQKIFLVSNGITQHNVSQPKIWADLNIGLDTSALQPFQVK